MSASTKFAQARKLGDVTVFYAVYRGLGTSIYFIQKCIFCSNFDQNFMLLK